MRRVPSLADEREEPRLAFQPRCYWYFVQSRRIHCSKRLLCSSYLARRCNECCRSIECTWSLNDRFISHIIHPCNDLGQEVLRLVSRALVVSRFRIESIICSVASQLAPQSVSFLSVFILHHYHRTLLCITAFVALDAGLRTSLWIPHRSHTLITMSIAPLYSVFRTGLGYRQILYVVCRSHTYNFVLLCIFQNSSLHYHVCCIRFCCSRQSMDTTSFACNGFDNGRLTLRRKLML